MTDQNSKSAILAKAQDPKPYSKSVILRKGGGSRTINFINFLDCPDKPPACRQAGTMTRHFVTAPVSGKEEMIMYRRGKFLTGFTLIELMLVVIIIGALAAMILPRLTGRSEQAKTAVARADVTSNIPAALDLYELDNGRYPSSEQGLGALLTKPGGYPEPKSWNGPYLKRKPTDPWGNEYKYRHPSLNDKDYDLYSLGSDGTESDDDVKSWE